MFSLRLCIISGCITGLLMPSGERFQNMVWHVHVSYSQDFQQGTCCLEYLRVQLWQFVVCQLIGRGSYPLSWTRLCCHLVSSHVPRG